jgi:predicted permease
MFARILGELRAIPGAQSVTMSAVRPISDNAYFVMSFRELGNVHLSQPQRVRAAFNHVAPGYFSTLGIPLVSGRDFTDKDVAGAPPVVIVSARMARHFEGNPVGQFLGSDFGPRQVVGVVNDVRYARVRDAEREVVYFPALQVKGFLPTFEIRMADGGPDAAVEIRTALARVDGSLIPFDMKTLERQTQESFARERLLAMLAGYFGLFAVLLACVGLYGLLSYTVTLRTPEMGLRMALGASPSGIRALIVRDSAWTVAIGTAAGLGAAALVGGLLRSQLFGVEPRDPVSLGGAALLLVVLALAAAYLPARRASRIDPLTALRHE